MARHWFGGSLADWAVTILDGVDGNDNIPQLAGGVIVTFWNSAVGGTQYPDLLVDGDPAEEVTTSEEGFLPAFQGPDNVWNMWADGGDGRFAVAAWDVGDFVADAITEASDAASTIQSHVASGNPHDIDVAKLSDVNLGGLAHGQVLAWDSGQQRWRPIEVEGVTGVVILDQAQTITGPKTFAVERELRPLVVQAATGQIADLLVLAAENTDETVRVGPEGNLVVSASTGQVGLLVRARTGQGQNLAEFRSGGGSLLAWVEPDGRMRGPNQGFVIPYSIPGELSVLSGRHRLYNDSGANLTIRSVRASVGVQPAGDDIVVDVLRNGSSIFGSAENRPTIPGGQHTSGRVTSIDSTTLAAGEYLTVSVHQVGSTSPGEDLTVQVQLY